MSDERPTANELARQCADIRDELDALRKDHAALAERYAAADLRYLLLASQLEDGKVSDDELDRMADRALNAIDRRLIFGDGGVNEFGQTRREAIAEAIRCGGIRWHRENNPDWRDKPWHDGISVDVDEQDVLDVLSADVERALFGAPVSS